MRIKFKPAILLMDLQLPGKESFNPALVKSQLASLPLVTITAHNDDGRDAKALADSYGALVLLDKMNLHYQLISTIEQFCVGESVSARAQISPQKVPLRP